MTVARTFDELSQADWLASIWQALRRIESTVAAQGVVEFAPPAVTVLPAPVDLTDVVEAVNQLKPGVSARDIAEALRDVIAPVAAPDTGTEVLAELAEEIKLLNFRIQGLGAQAYGGGSVSFAPGQLDPISAGLVGIARGITDYESRLDYDVRTDAQPAYVGRALNGTATSAAWTIEKVTYDGADRPTRKQVLTGAWDNRATLNW